MNINDIKEFFVFSRKERNGIIILISIIIIILFVNKYIDRIIIDKDNKSNDFKEFKAEIDRFEKSLQIKKVKEESKKNSKLVKEKIQQFKPFKFDPNNISQYKWQKLGLTKKNIQTINNYISKGGRFYCKEDFKKIYGISNKKYEQLKPYIIIKKDSIKKKSIDIIKKQYKKEDLRIVEINDADVEELKMIRGIGDAFSNRIVKYRDILGGFLEKKQLLEVYGINEEKYEQIKDYIRIDSSKIKKININTAQFSELIRHPYIDKYHTQAILQYRKLMGGFQRVDELKENGVLEKKIYRKVEKYFIVK